MSTLHLIDHYSRRYRAKEGIGGSWTRLDCHACGELIETGSKVILESRPMGKAGKPNAWHPACFAGQQREAALERHRAEHNEYPEWIRHQFDEKPQRGKPDRVASER